MSAFSKDPRTSLIALTRLRAQSRKDEVSICHEPAQGMWEESCWDTGGCSWGPTQKWQGPVWCPHLSCPHALLSWFKPSLIHSGVFRDTSPPLAHTELSLWHKEWARGPRLKEAHPRVAFRDVPKERCYQSEVTSRHCLSHWPSWNPKE